MWLSSAGFCAHNVPAQNDAVINTPETMIVRSFIEVPFFLREFFTEPEIVKAARGFCRVARV
jgi:hypothetical protein